MVFFRAKKPDGQPFSGARHSCANRMGQYAFKIFHPARALFCSLVKRAYERTLPAVNAGARNPLSYGRE